MAKLRTPLLSFGAAGKIARTIVYFAWKGIDVAREYVVPSNPQTADQTTQRDLFTACVSAWRNYITDSAMRTAWNLMASAGKKAMSGFNRGMEALLQILGTTADASFAVAISEAAQVVTFAMENMDDGAAGDEAGDFDVWVGDSATSLLYLEGVAIAAADVVTSDLGDADDIKYVQLRKTGYARSGICKITLTA